MNLGEMIETHKPEVWLDALESYQRHSLEALGLGELDPEEVAKAWLDATTSHTITFGAGGDSRPFFDNIKREILRFICDSDSYETEKAQLRRQSNVTELFAVSVISRAISPVVGASNVFLAPLVAVILFSIAKVTVAAVCETFRQEKQALTNEVENPDSE